MTQITLQGNPVNTNGELPAVGDQAPNFKLVDQDLNDVQLDALMGRKKIISTVPSLDTGACAKYTKRFNELASQHNDIQVLIVSADLPFAQSRFCGIEKLANVQPLSMMRSRNFAKDYGILLVDGPLAGLITRSVIAIDENNTVVYTQLLGEVSAEPDYQSAFEALS